MLISHKNIPFGDLVYCERRRDIIPFNQNYHQYQCSPCPYYGGTMLGDGIDCVYDDEGAEPSVVISNPAAFAQKRMKTLAKHKNMAHVIDLGKGK